jgi:cation diffusion facilitator family transporter
MAGNSRKAILAALFANLGIAIAKFVGFGVTGAASMLAEAIHSVADTSNQALLLYGARRAQQAASEAHPFGYGRARYFWSFVVAIVLFTVGGLFALYEGIEKLRHPHALESPAWALGILGVAILLETLSLRTALVEANRERGTRGWVAFIRHAKVPELPVVLLEDLGALVGLVIAFIGVVAAMLSGNPRFDAMGSIAIGALLCAIGIILAVEMKSLLMGEAATPEMIEALGSTIRAHPTVKRLIHMRTNHLGPEELLVAVKVELSGELSFSQVAAEINALEARLRQAVPIARVIYIEPDVHR